MARASLVPKALVLVLLFVEASRAEAAPSKTVGGRPAAILRYAQQWLGTPYVFGGNARSGIDCSAYSRHMYRDLFGLRLPRTTSQQIHLGKPIGLNSKQPTQGLVPGDLIFFVNALGTPRHVVVYIGGGKITHSESGRGVVIDPIRRAFGRRLIARRLMTAKGLETRRKESSAVMPLEESVEIPCPPVTSISDMSLRRLRYESIREVQSEVHSLDWDLCELRYVISQLESRAGPHADSNAVILRMQAELVENMDDLQDFLKSRLQNE